MSHPILTLITPSRVFPLTGATAWTSHVGREMYNVMFQHDAFWMGEVIDHSLVNPKQLPHHGVTVQDNNLFDHTAMHIAAEDG